MPAWAGKPTRSVQIRILFVYYSIGDSEALHLLSYRNPRDAQDPDGFFMLLLAPRPELPDTGHCQGFDLRAGSFRQHGG